MTRIRLASAVLALPLVVSGLAACGTQADPRTAPTPTQSSTAIESPSPTDSASATPTLDPVGPDATLEERLLPPDALPGFNDEWTWAETRTDSTPSEPIGVCSRFDPLSIGANDGITRAYAAQAAVSDAAAATMTVLDFPDTKTALRAVAVLKSWHDSCTERIKPRLKPRVEPIQDVTVPTGSGAWYLVTSTKPRSGEGHFQALGMSQVGSRMALLTMDHDGQDHNYEPGQDPMEQAVALAADRLR